MALELQPPIEPKRVKVYELKDNDWFDRGTGFCTGQMVEVRFSDPPGLRATAYSRAADCRLRNSLTLVFQSQEEYRLFVESETEPNRVLLESRITKEDGYQKQQGPCSRCHSAVILTCALIDTLIVWTEPNGTDMALSFQESEGCTTVW